MSVNTRLRLPNVTLCAVTSVNVAATLRALEASLEQVTVDRCLLLTDACVESQHPDIEVVPIDPLLSSSAYSDFLLTRLIDYIETSYCMVAQWDGHVLDARCWDPAFLDYDYIGASWPQFGDGHDVGNGGFSLRSRRLMELCRAPGFTPTHPEDVAIGRGNRIWLEAHGIRFAPRALADRFAIERTGDPGSTFGYHGVFNMPVAIGVDSFWHVYKVLDELSSVRHDFGSILWHVLAGPRGIRRGMRMMCDRVLSMPRRPSGGALLSNSSST